MAPDDEELRAADLLPADDPPPAVRRIAERRVAGWFTAERLAARATWRPAGNSRVFWLKIEEDDPFLPSPDLPGARQELYPADRLGRVPSPILDPPRAAPQAPPPAARPSPPAERPTPKPAPKPAPKRPAPVPPSDDEPPAPVERRLPPFAPNPTAGGATGKGRIRVSRPQPSRPQPPPPEAKSASEIRAEKERAREEAAGPPAPPSLRGLDSVLGVLGDLAAAQEIFEQEQAAKEAEKKAQKSQPGPPRRRGSGGLDDLLGGGPNEGRVRIGGRTKPKDEEGG